MYDKLILLPAKQPKIVVELNTRSAALTCIYIRAARNPLCTLPPTLDPHFPHDTYDAVEF